MAWVFVRLKLRLLAGARVSSRAAAVGWITRIAGLSVALLGATDLADVPRRGGAGAVAVCVGVTVAWVMLPLLAGSDRTLDAQRFALLPLTRRQLARGLFVASWVGAPPVATLVLLSGLFFDYRPPGVGAVVVALDVLVATLLAVTAGRTASALLVAAVHSRRGRDTASVVLAVVSACGYIGWRLAAGLAVQVDRLRPSPLLSALSWLPPGALARSMAEAHDGRLAVASADLAYGAATVVALGVAWAWALDRRLTNPVATESSGRARLPRLRLSLPGPRSLAASVAVKDLRYAWRAPVQRANAITGLVTAGFFALPLITRSWAAPYAPFAAAVMAFFMLANLAGNVFGVDGSAFATYILAGSPTAALVRGKGLAVVAFGLAVSIPLAVVLAAVVGGLAQLPGALLAAAGVCGISAGCGLVQSVVAPFPVDLSRPAVGRQRRQPGQGRPLVGLVVFASELALIALGAGLIAVGALALGVGTLPGAAAAAALGWLVFRLGARVAKRRLGSRLPETLVALSTGR